VDQEVAKTLGELELKLQQLEHELTSIGPRDAPAASQQAVPALGDPSPPPGRLVDEAVEPESSEPALAEGDGFGGPPVFGGEEVPSQAGATTEREWTVDVRETAYGEIPTPPAPMPPSGPPIPPPMPGPPQREPQPIDRAELVRFKQKLERTMADLIDEYSKLLLPKPPA
jgi:hypothetical protein